MCLSNWKTNCRCGSSASQLSECVGTCFLVCTISVPPRQALNYLNDFVTSCLSQRHLRFCGLFPASSVKEVLVAAPVRQHSPLMQCQQVDNPSNSTWDLCIWPCSGMAIRLEKNIYTYICVSRIPAWLQPQINSRKEVTLSKGICTLIFLSPSSFPVYSSC